MSNVIKDFWTFQYKNKNYFGICEVVKGDIEKRTTKVYETHIEKALAYTMRNKCLSHMSIQKFSTWKTSEKRKDSEDKYYPFTIEFEPQLNNNIDYADAVMEADIFVNHLIQNGVNSKDILILISNSKSIYVLVNPKVYGLKPSSKLHSIYMEMYKQINKEYGFKSVDLSIIGSSYKLMKTPNSWYAGGYFTYISVQQLGNLMLDDSLKSKYTKARKSLDYEVPGQACIYLMNVYNEARIRAENYYNSDSYTLLEDQQECKERKCVKYIRKAIIEKGIRNYALVSVGLNLKESGFSKAAVEKELIELGKRWNHDERPEQIKSKVSSIFRTNKRFKCDYARTLLGELGVENMCSKCQYCYERKKVSNDIWIHSKIINDLWSNKASTRHFLLYIELAKKNLINRWFNPLDEKINERTLRELNRKTEFLERKKDGDFIFMKMALETKGMYKLPGDFLITTAKDLGDYIKHYLKLLVKGYRAFNTYLLVRISKLKIKQELRYSNISSVYNLLKVLKDAGLIITKKNHVMCLYFKSFKVIDIKFYKSEANEKLKSVVNQNEQINFFKKHTKYINKASP